MLNCGRYGLSGEIILKLIRFFVMCLHQTKVTTVYHTLLFALTAGTCPRRRRRRENDECHYITEGVFPGRTSLEIESGWVGLAKVGWEVFTSEHLLLKHNLSAKTAIPENIVAKLIIKTLSNIFKTIL